MLRKHMRETGVGHVPRGKRQSTRLNPLSLTNRELVILSRVADGMSNAQIGTALFISAKTVDHHVSSILLKLGVASRAEAGRLARSQGLVTQNREGGPVK